MAPPGFNNNYNNGGNQQSQQMQRANSMPVPNSARHNNNGQGSNMMRANTDCPKPGADAERDRKRAAERWGNDQRETPQPNQGKAPSNMMRANTEFVRSADQMTNLRSNQMANPQQEKVRKSMIKLEAQKLAEHFRPRVERVIEEEDEECEDYTVEMHGGDMHRRFLAKVRIGEDEYVHLCARRLITKEGWICQYALGKNEKDPLMDHDPDYTDLPQETVCSIITTTSSCSMQ